MPHKTIAEFKEERIALNEILLRSKHQQIGRFFNIDHNVYADGALPAKTKEMLGLVASMVLRYDDCITYQIIQCSKQKITVAAFDSLFAATL